MEGSPAMMPGTSGASPALPMSMIQPVVEPMLESGGALSGLRVVTPRDSRRLGAPAPDGPADAVRLPAWGGGVMKYAACADMEGMLSSVSMRRMGALPPAPGKAPELLPPASKPVLRVGPLGRNISPMEGYAPRPSCPVEATC